MRVYTSELLFNAYSPDFRSNQDLIVSSVAGIELFSLNGSHKFYDLSGIVKAISSDSNSYFPWDLYQSKPSGEFFVNGSVYSDGFSPNQEVIIECGDIKKTIYAQGEGKIIDGFFSQKITHQAALIKKPITYPLNSTLSRDASSDDSTVNCCFTLSEGEILPLSKFIPDAFLCIQPLSSKLKDPVAFMKDLPNFFKSSNFPYPTEYFDSNLFYRAHHSQRISHYWNGNEKFRIKSLHNEHRDYCGALPGINFRCYFKYKDSDEILSTNPVIDTIVFVPDSNMILLVARSKISHAGVDFSNVSSIMPAFEYSATPRSDEYYHLIYNYRSRSDLYNDFVINNDQLSPSSYSLSDILDYDAKRQSLDSLVDSPPLSSVIKNELELNSDDGLNDFNSDDLPQPLGQNLNLDSSLDSASFPVEAISSSHGESEDIIDLANNNLSVDGDINAALSSMGDHDPKLASLINSINNLPNFPDLDEILASVDQVGTSSRAESSLTVSYEELEAKISALNDSLSPFPDLTSFDDANTATAEQPNDSNILNQIDLMLNDPKFTSLPSFTNDDFGLADTSSEGDFIKSNISIVDELNIIREQLISFVPTEAASLTHEPNDALDLLLVDGVNVNQVLNPDLSSDDIAVFAGATEPQQEFPSEDDVSSGSVDPLISSQPLTPASDLISTSKVIYQQDFFASHFSNGVHEGFIFDSCKFHSSIENHVFNKCIFLNCIFDESHVISTSFTQSKFESTKFLSSSYTSCTFSSTNFIDCDSDHFKFISSRFDDVQFDNVKLISSLFQSSSLSSVYFSYSTIEMSSFEELEATSLHFYDSRLGYSKFNKCQLTDARFNYSNLDSICFTHSKLSDGSIISSSLNNGSFTHVTAPDFSIIDSDLSYSTISFSDISKSYVLNTNLRHATLNNNNFSESSFNSSNLSKASILSSNFVGSRMRLIDASFASFQKSVLFNVDLSGAILTGTIFSDSTLPHSLERFIA